MLLLRVLLHDGAPEVVVPSLLVVDLVVHELLKGAWLPWIDGRTPSVCVCVKVGW
jgi:hypothetical protein